MIKKRSRKNKKRKRFRTVEDSLDDEATNIQPSEKKRKLNPTVSSSKTSVKKNGEVGKRDSEQKISDKEKKIRDATRKDYSKLAHKNVRLNSEVDFLDIGICKDFQRTGHCGYGMNCIYAHIREDYKSSFQIAKEYEEEQRREREGLNESDSDSDSDSDEDGVPKTCSICRNDFTNPVVTNCHHFFCEKCILKKYNFGKNPHCPVCGSPTEGIFNSADTLIEGAKKKEAERKKKKDEEKTPDRNFRMGWNY